MKNRRLITHKLRYVFYILLTCVLCVGCVENKQTLDTYDSGDYRSFATMLNQCKGNTIVVGVSEMDGSWSHAKINIVVIDSTNTAYGCRIGGDLGLSEGDTVKRVGNAR